ncbi:MAG: YcxB family protein [Bacillota bacterium]|nr:YcxB family protein [Bacillota bacterium]
MSIEKKIEAKISTENIIEYWKNYFFRKHTRDIVVNSILISIALLIYFFSEFIVLAAIIIIFCAMYLLFIFYFYYHGVLSKLKKGAKYYDNLLIMLSDEGIQLIGGLSESKTKWEAFSYIVMEKEYYLLFSNLGKFIPIPTEAFSKEEDLLWFEEKLNNAGIKKKQHK